MEYSRTPSDYGLPLNTDTSSLRTVYFVPGQKKPFHFLYIQPAWYWHPVNTKTFFGPLSLRINGLWLYSQFVLLLGWHFTWTIFTQSSCKNE